MREYAFMCATCHHICCWDCERHLEMTDSLMVKTIGSRYCDCCYDREVADLGISSYKVTERHHQTRTGARCSHSSLV